MFPTMSSLRKKGSTRKGGTRYTNKASLEIPEFEMLAPSGKANGFVIQITEGRPSISEPVPAGPEQRAPVQQSPRRRPQPPPLAIPPKAHIVEEQKPDIAPNPIHPSPVYERAPSAADVPLPRSNAPTPIPVEQSHAISPEAETPMMRSMFPRYDPNRPLARQSYYPDMETAPRLASAMAVAGSASNNRNSNNPYRQQMARSSSEPLTKASPDSQRSGNAEVKESPLRTVESSEQQTTYSNPEKLTEVWNIANGQAASKDTADTYHLELSW